VPRDYLQDAACDLPFKIAAPWISYLRFYVDFAGVGDVGGQPHTRKSRLREIHVVFGDIQFAHASFASAAVRQTVPTFGNTGGMFFRF